MSTKVLFNEVWLTVLTILRDMKEFERSERKNNKLRTQNQF